VLQYIQPDMMFINKRGGWERDHIVICESKLGPFGGIE